MHHFLLRKGAYVARVIAARVRGTPAPAPFRYRHLGTMATIGRNSAVADFGKFRLSGFIAWLLWASCTSATWSVSAIGSP